MSRRMIVGGKTSADIKSGFGFLPGVIIDQHLSQRQRLVRLLDALKQEIELVLEERRNGTYEENATGQYQPSKPSLHLTPV